MAEKGGWGAIPVFPQNMLAVKEDNPRKFYGQCCYLVWWVVLLGLFIAYAAFNLRDFLDLQDQPIIATHIRSAEELTYPIFIVCPFQALPTPDYKVYGLFPEENWYKQSKDQLAFIDKTGGLKKGDTENQQSKGGDDKDKKDKEKAGLDVLNLGNTGSTFPAKKSCGSDGGFVISDPKKRLEENEFQDRVADNLQTLLLKSVVGIDDAEKADSDSPDKKDKKKDNTNAYYTCLVFNADRQITLEDRNRLGNPFTEEEEKKGCSKDGEAADISEKDGNPKKEKGDWAQAIARDTGYFDGYVMVIKTYWKYVDNDDDGRPDEPDEGTVQSLSITLATTVDSIEPTAAEYSNIGIPVGVTAILTLKKIEFKCEECDDDELTIFYNSTISIVDLSKYPAIPRERRSDNSLLVRTQIQVFFQSMTVTEEEEVITQGVLDYLGNFAGMLGTLLAFSVLGSVDRLCSYIFIGNGHLASVWDD